MATVSLGRQTHDVPRTAATPEPRVRDLTQVFPKSPSLAVSRPPLRLPRQPTPFNASGAQRCDTKRPQNEVIEVSSDDESGESDKTYESDGSDDSDDSDESGELDLANLWCYNGSRLRSRSDTGTGTGWNSHG